MYLFNPMTEEQIQLSSLMESGIYDFEVIKSNKKTSKSGNPMAELNLNVWDKEGKQHVIYDYLVFSNIPLNIKKIKHFCDSTGLSKDYERGCLPENLERLSGKAIIGIQEEQPNPNGGFYPKKNVVTDYVIQDKSDIKQNPKEEEFKDDTDIPF